MSRYRATVLTPLLVGDGHKLAPIDYMVWKDQVNVLDQRRIFKLLAKGSRLDSYLTQIRKADRLDFSSWGGYAQNYALRRISLEDSSIAAVHERERPENLFIPTFAGASNSAAFLPATALKGVFRTAHLASRTRENHLKEWEEQLSGERFTRLPGAALERTISGESASTRTRSLQLSDSETLPGGVTRVYLLRTATLVERGPKTELAWKAAPRGSVDPKRIVESTPYLAEMAVPGTEFWGAWRVPVGLQQPSLLKMLHWREALGPKDFTAAANELSGRLLGIQREYAQTAGLSDVERTVDALVRRLEEVRALPQSCLTCIGWGGGYLSKALLAEDALSAYRPVLANSPLYGSAIRTGLPFPKTRRILFLKGRPASLPGWVQIDFV